MASSLTICGLDSCGDSWIDMMRNARWAAASASFNNRTNISTDLPDNSNPKKGPRRGRSEEHTSELQSLMRISYAVFCLKKKITNIDKIYNNTNVTRQQPITYT